MYYQHNYSTDLTGPLSPLSEHNGKKDVKSWYLPSSENDFVTMQQKMLGLDTQQRKIMREYEAELDAMKSEIKKIRVDYDGLKQKNSRYRSQLKEKSEQVKRLADEQARAVRKQQTTQPELNWNAEKTKLLTKIKQLEIERKQAEERCASLLSTKDENADLRRELESMKFREKMWKEEKEMAERKRRKLNENKDSAVVRYTGSVNGTTKQPLAMEWSSTNPKSTYSFDEAFEQITRSDAPYKSIPSIHIVNYTESEDLKDIRKSLNEAREELMRSSNNLDMELESARSARLVKSDSQAKKDQFLAELKEREELQKTVLGLKDQRDTDAVQVREKITTLESKIASLESNCLTEVQNLVHNVDILKQELINSQRELESLKEYSRQMEKKREEEKMQILNESRELKLDLSSLRTEIRDKSQGSDRTDLSRGPLTVTTERTSPSENFDSQYSPLVGFVGSRCDYLKMKLETLKKHLHNLDCQTQTVLTQSLGEAGEDTDVPQPTTDGTNKATPKARSIKAVSPALGSRRSTKKRTSPTISSVNSSSKTSNSNNTEKKHTGCALVEAIRLDDEDDDDECKNKCNEDDDDDEIPVLTPRPHRNKYDKDMDTLIVENGQNIERLRLPSLEEDEEEDGNEDDDDDSEDDGDESMEYGKSHRDSARSQRDSARSQRDSARGERREELPFMDSDGNNTDSYQARQQLVLESPRERRPRDHSLPRVEEEDESVIKTFLNQEKKRATSLERQVESRFEKLEQELENRRRKGAMPAFHHLMPKSAH